MIGELIRWPSFHVRNGLKLKKKQKKNKKKQKKNKKKQKKNKKKTKTNACFDHWKFKAHVD